MPDRKKGAPFCMNDIMSGQHFEDITKALSYKSVKAPTYKDHFWEISQMMSKWNKNMKQAFVPGWIVYLDESISIWTNQ